MSEPAITIISFGHLHTGDQLPDAHVVYDLRTHFKDPHVTPALQDLTGKYQAVIDAVLSTPGIPFLITAAMCTINAYTESPSQKPLTIAFGCAGGRHRSVVVADQVAGRLRQAGVAVVVQHRHLNRPVVRRGAR